MRKAWLGTLCFGMSLSVWAATAVPVAVPMKDASGADVGTVTFVQKGKAVEMKVAVKSLPPGEHGIHVHQGSACTPPDFQSAAGHLNPDSKHHGFSNPEGHHAGDFPLSVKVGADGTGKATLRSTDLSLAAGAPTSPYGHTVVIHELVDDQKTDPAGASGKRIACGVVPETAAK